MYLFIAPEEREKITTTMFRLNLYFVFLKEKKERKTKLEIENDRSHYFL
jgi:hypothetical protein